MPILPPLQTAAGRTSFDSQSFAVPHPRKVVEGFYSQTQKLQVELLRIFCERREEGRLACRQP